MNTTSKNSQVSRREFYSWMSVAFLFLWLTQVTVAANGGVADTSEVSWLAICLLLVCLAIQVFFAFKLRGERRSAQEQNTDAA